MLCISLASACSSSNGESESIGSSSVNIATGTIELDILVLSISVQIDRSNGRPSLSAGQVAIPESCRPSWLPISSGCGSNGTSMRSSVGYASWLSNSERADMQDWEDVHIDTARARKVSIAEPYTVRQNLPEE